MKTPHIKIHLKKTLLKQVKRGLAGISLSACAVIGSQALAAQTPVISYYLNAPATTNTGELCNSSLENVRHETFTLSKSRQDWLALEEVSFTVSLNSTEMRDFLWNECIYTLFVTGDNTTDFTTNFTEVELTDPQGSSISLPGTITRNFTNAQSDVELDYKAQVSIKVEPIGTVSP